MVIKGEEKFEKARDIKNNVKSRKYHDRILSNRKKIIHL